MIGRGSPRTQQRNQMKRITRIAQVFALVVPALVINAAAQDALPAPKKQACIDAEIDASLHNLSDLVGDADGVVGQLEFLKVQLCTPASVDAEPMPLEPKLDAVIEAVIQSARFGFMTYFEA